MSTSRSLGVEECWERLRENVVGRIGFDIGHGIRIHPVNYAVDGETVVVRTAPDTELARCVQLFADGAVVAFEIDVVDHDHHQGWSVLLSGRLSTVSVDERNDMKAVWAPRPWVGDDRDLWLRLTPVEVTGRELGLDWSAGRSPVRRLV